MENLNLFKLVLEQLPDGMIIFDEKDEIIFANSMAEKIRRIPRNENLGQSLLNFLKLLRTNDRNNHFHRIHSSFTVSSSPDIRITHHRRYVFNIIQAANHEA